MTVEVDPQATHSAVLVLVPEAEPVVGPHRWQLDPTARAGVPAHVTVLYPFVPPGRITAGTVESLREAVRGFAAFSCRFDKVRWFGDEYVWLGPTPHAPFDELTQRIGRAFPDHSPYEGAHEPLAHLTVGHRRHVSLDALRVAAAQIEPYLPVQASVDRVHLLAGSPADDSWRVVAEAPFST